MRSRVALLCLGLAAVPVAGFQSTAALPPRLDSYITSIVKLAPSERATLTAGGVVTKLLEADESKEVAIFGAAWINGTMRSYTDAVADIENFERGGPFIVTKRVSAPPRLEDFAELRLPEQDVEDLRTCRVGDCEVKLGEQALQRFRTEVNWNAPDRASSAHALMRTLALEYATGYVEGGNDRLAVYRDSSRPTFVAQEFRTMIDQMPELTTYLPDVRRYLHEYPRGTPPDSTSFLYWQETAFGLKPTIRLTHVTVWERPEGSIITSKLLYASHYFWTGLELRVLVPDPARGPGFWLVSISRSRADGLSGLTGMIVRERAQSEALNGALSALQSIQRNFQAR